MRAPGHVRMQPTRGMQDLTGKAVRHRARSEINVLRRNEESRPRPLSSPARPRAVLLRGEWSKRKRRLLASYIEDIVELKAAKTLADEHVAQSLGCLKPARMEHGLLINFGSYKFEIKKYALSAAKTQGHAGGILALSSAISAFFCG